MRLIAACETFGPYCLIGDWAVNCFVELVYTLDADIVAIASSLAKLAAHLRKTPASQLRIQFTTDDRYQTFLARSVEAGVLGVHVKIACLEDVTQGKLWAYNDPAASEQAQEGRIGLDPAGGGVSRVEVSLPCPSCRSNSTADDRLHGYIAGLSCSLAFARLPTVSLFTIGFAQKPMLSTHPKAT